MGLQTSLCPHLELSQWVPSDRQFFPWCCCCGVTVAAVYNPDPERDGVVQVLGDFLAGINHHEGIYNKLTEVQQLYQQSIAAANSSEPADRQLQHKVRASGHWLGPSSMLNGLCSITTRSYSTSCLNPWSTR